MGLIKEILKDYGTIPFKIGMVFLKYNPISLKQLRKFIKLNEIELRNGLSILIQKRFVKYYWMEKEIIYVLDSKIIKKRIHFAVYLNYIKQKYSKECFKYFKKILINGIYKECSESLECKELINQKILEMLIFNQINKKENKENKELLKRKKIQGQYININYDYLDQCIYEIRMYEFICKLYNKAAGEIYKSILKINIIESNNIIKNLESTKILLLDKNNCIINNKKNINEYLKYLYFGKILTKTNEINNIYNLSRNTNILKKYLINIMISNNKYKRIFNMVYDKNGINDKYISMNALISIGQISSILLNLEWAGLLIQKSQIIHKINNKIEYLWIVDLNYSSNVIINTFENKISKLLKNYNNMWKNNYFKDNTHGIEISWISDIISMSNDFIIFNIN